MILSCDDSYLWLLIRGEASLMNKNLEIIKKMECNHSNISFSCDFIYSNGNKTNQYAITSGFDC